MDNPINEQEAALEQVLKEKGHVAPRLTPTLVDAQIVATDYHVFPNSQHTVCCLTLQNGFTVIGESACASPENFDAAIGQDVAFQRARGKIWSLEAYMLKELLSGTRAIQPEEPV